MIFTTLSPKNQTTLSMEFVKALGLAPGTRLKQSLEGNRIVIEPIAGVMTAFGALAADGPVFTIKEETEGMEAAVAREVAAKAGLV